MSFSLTIGQHAELEQSLQRLARVQVLDAVHEVVRREQHLPGDESCVPSSALIRANNRGWPTAAIACSVPMSVGRCVSPSAGMPAAIAPDITSTTCVPGRARGRDVGGELGERGVVELARLRA